MNAVTGFVAIVSLLLALTVSGGVAEEQAGAVSPAERHVTPSKIVLNHNETLVRDAAPVQQEETWSEWWMSVKAFVYTKFLASARAPGGDCDEFGCGTNHNETLMRDAAR